jgi:hypothetical protein
MSTYYTPMFPHQGSVDTIRGLARNMECIRILKYRQMFLVFLEMWREFLSYNWWYWSNLLAQQTVSLFSGR